MTQQNRIFIDIISVKWKKLLCPFCGFFVHFCLLLKFRGVSRAATTSKMERFVIIVNGFQPLIITKRSILVVAAVLDPPLLRYSNFKKLRDLDLMTSTNAWNTFYWITWELNSLVTKHSQFMSYYTRKSFIRNST